mmetsp:Transcript_87428/g.271657  ORF Transcript_87428/g.271657 Transcript_87428/m.271657 type:complete len:303 (-) Transcript_87428:31-939(-)
MGAAWAQGVPGNLPHRFGEAVVRFGRREGAQQARIPVRLPAPRRLPRSGEHLRGHDPGDRRRPLLLVRPGPEAGPRARGSHEAYHLADPGRREVAPRARRRAPRPLPREHPADGNGGLQAAAREDHRLWHGHPVAKMPAGDTRQAVVPGARDARGVRVRHLPLRRLRPGSRDVRHGRPGLPLDVHQAQRVPAVRVRQPLRLQEVPREAETPQGERRASDSGLLARAGRPPRWLARGRAPGQALPGGEVLRRGGDLRLDHGLAGGGGAPSRRGAEHSGRRLRLRDARAWESRLAAELQRAARL